MTIASRTELEEAYAEAARTATRSATMGVLGFGLSLVMFALISGGEAPLGAAFWLEKLLIAGGLAGGVTFTILGLRASRAAERIWKLLNAQAASPDSPVDDR